MNELMTGWIGTGINPLSRISVAAMADIGYGVDLSAADSYALPLPLASDPAAVSQPVIGWDELYEGPVFVLEPSRDSHSNRR